MNAADLFNTKLPVALTTHAERARSINTIYLFKITGSDGGMWTVDLMSSTPSCQMGDFGTAKCTMELSSSDFQQVLGNPSLAMQLYFQGRIKISGDSMAGMKVKTLFELLA